MSKGSEFDLEERLIDFAVRIIKLTEALPNTRSGNHIRGQVLRSGTSPAPNYAEAQSAESRSDFVHKIKIALKELRETKVWLRMIGKADLVDPPSKLDPADTGERRIDIHLSGQRQDGNKEARV